VPLVVAIEPDPRQAAILGGIVRRRVGADLLLADSKDAAMAAIRKKIPDLILVSALFSPRDETELTEELRLLEGTAHLQTLTIPLLAAPTRDTPEEKRTLLGAFTRRRPKIGPQGCDPAIFAEEVRVYLQRAREFTAERTAQAQAADQEQEPTGLTDGRIPSLGARIENEGTVPASEFSPGQPTSIEQPGDSLAREDVALIPVAAPLPIDIRKESVEAPPPAPVPEPLAPPVVAEARAPGPDLPPPAEPGTTQRAPEPVPKPERGQTRTEPRPVEDEWGFYDPAQCGMEALFARLAAIEAPEEPAEPDARSVASSRTVEPPSRQITGVPSRQISESPRCQITKSPSHQISWSTNRLIPRSTGHGRPP
jgi:hypothetical protein